MIFFISLVVVVFVGCQLGVDNFFATGNSSSLEKIDDNTVCWKYRRFKNTFLVYIEMVTDFTSVDLTVTSSTDTQFVTFIQDKDGGEFMHLTNLQKNDVTPIHLLEGDFKPTKGNSSLDTKKVRQLPAFLDLKSILDPDGSENKICFRTNVTFSFDNLIIQKKDIYLVNQDLVIDQSTKIIGNIVATNSRIIVTSSRFELEGDITLTSGSEFNMVDGSWIFHEKYNHEHSITLYNTSKVAWERGTLFMYYPYSFPLVASSMASLYDVEFTVGSFTCVIQSGSSLFLNSVKKFGEILAPAETKLSIRDSDTVLIWMEFSEVIKSPFQIPGSSSDFNTMDVPGLQQHDISVANSSGVIYGIILFPNGFVSIYDSDVRAVAMTFGKGHNVVKGIKNGLKYDDKTIYGSKPQGIHVKNCSVDTWNFYDMDTSGEVTLLIDDSVFGESICYGLGRINITNSRCDGTGGYLGANEHTEMNIMSSTITTKVISKGYSKMYFSDCSIKGDVYVENGQIVLENTKVDGQMIKNGNGTIIIK